MRHLTVNEVVRLRTAGAGSADYRRAARHLAAGCHECALAIAALVGVEQLKEMMAGAAGYDSVIEDFKRRLEALFAAARGCCHPHHNPSKGGDHGNE